MAIRIKATNSSYRSGNVAYLYEHSDGDWRCALASGTPASFWYAGIGPDEMACRFDLMDATTAEEALIAALKHARRYLSGPKQGATVYDYEIVAPPN